MAEEPKWRTRQGVEIPIRSLTDDHLRNILAGLRDGTLFPRRGLPREKNKGLFASTEVLAYIGLFNNVQEGARQKWLRILGAEAERRGLPIQEADDGLDCVG